MIPGLVLILGFELGFLLDTVEGRLRKRLRKMALELFSLGVGSVAAGWD